MKTVTLLILLFSLPYAWASDSTALPPEVTAVPISSGSGGAGVVIDVKATFDGGVTSISGRLPSWHSQKWSGGGDSGVIFWATPSSYRVKLEVRWPYLVDYGSKRVICKLALDVNRRASCSTLKIIDYAGQKTVQVSTIPSWPTSFTLSADGVDIGRGFMSSVLSGTSHLNVGWDR